MFSRRWYRLCSRCRVSSCSPGTLASKAIVAAARKRCASTTSGRPLVPRNYPSSGFEVIDTSIEIEEETLPFYDSKWFYPVRLGEVMVNQYQVVAKLGYGTTSTVWLCHDLIGQRYVTLKVHINIMTSNRELKVYNYLDGIDSDHPGKDMIRMLENSFKLQGPHGIHEVFVLPPLGLSLRAFQDMMPNRKFERTIVSVVIHRVLTALNFFHRDANLIHAGNLLFSIEDVSLFAEFEAAEFARPSARKVRNGYTIHMSQFLLESFGQVYLCDLGDARIGDRHEGIAMPVQYRAPEIILDMSWGREVDMWSVGILAWDLLEPNSLFHIYAPDDPARNEAHHLAHMTALLGPPPLEFLRRSSKSWKYWDENGNWKDVVPLPETTSLGSLATSLQGEDRKKFLDLVGSLLCWLPEERLDSYQAFKHPWVFPS